MTVQSGNFAKLLEPGLRKVFFETYTEKPEQYGNFMRVKGSRKAKETDYHVAGTGMWPTKESMGPISYEDIAPGDEAVYIHAEYAKGIQVERKLVDDEMYDVIDKMPKSLGRGARATVETIACDVLNNGFTTNGYDGVPLFSDAHPLIKGGTADNLSDLTLTDEHLKTNIILFRTQPSEEGLKIQAKPDKLLIPPDLEFTAITILESKQKSGTPNNDINAIRGKLDLIILDYLTSATAWFLLDSTLHELTFFWRVKPEFKSEENFDTMVAKYRGYMRFSAGYSNWRGILGSDGTEDGEA
jgi:phage major head subunit gpT-like protein